MLDNKFYEALANLVLQSISVWEDMHTYVLSHSLEYNTFWGQLDDQLKSGIYRYQKRNRNERIVPFSMSLTEHYKYVLKPDSYMKIKDQHWKKQLKLIVTDDKFCLVMRELNQIVTGCGNNGESYYEQQAVKSETGMRVIYGS